MRVTICSSASLYKKAEKLQKQLEKKGINVEMYPTEMIVGDENIGIEEYYKRRKKELDKDCLEVKTNLMHQHFKKIRDSDAILVMNYDKDNKVNYIGGNTFAEMTVAFFLNKKIFTTNPLPEYSSYYEEIAAMNPIVIKNLDEIK